MWRSVKSASTPAVGLFSNSTNPFGSWFCAVRDWRQQQGAQERHPRAAGCVTEGSSPTPRRGATGVRERGVVPAVALGWCNAGPCPHDGRLCARDAWFRGVDSSSLPHFFEVGLPTLPGARICALRLRPGPVPPQPMAFAWHRWARCGRALVGAQTPPAPRPRRSSASGLRRSPALPIVALALSLHQFGSRNPLVTTISRGIYVRIV